MLTLAPRSAADIQAAVGGRLIGADGTPIRLTTTHGVPCQPTHASFGHADEAEVLAGRATWLEVTLTGDGRFYRSGGFHRGEECSEDWVWVERWGTAGCEFHGWIHRQTRLLLQAG